jgi:hypothetical protein
MARDYIAQHPELFAEVKETMEDWHRQGMFDPRGGIRNPSCYAS